MGEPPQVLPRVTTPRIICLSILAASRLPTALPLDEVMCSFSRVRRRVAAAPQSRPASAIGLRAMHIGILGSGLMGGKLGTIFARAGHEVVFSYPGSEQKLNLAPPSVTLRLPPPPCPTLFFHKILCGWQLYTVSPCLLFCKS
jgi:hypothetical protein